MYSIFLFFEPDLIGVLNFFMIKIVFFKEVIFGIFRLSKRMLGDLKSVGWNESEWVIPDSGRGTNRKLRG